MRCIKYPYSMTRISDVSSESDKIIVERIPGFITNLMIAIEYTVEYFLHISTLNFSSKLRRFIMRTGSRFMQLFISPIYYIYKTSYELDRVKQNHNHNKRSYGTDWVVYARKKA